MVWKAPVQSVGSDSRLLYTGNGGDVMRAKSRIETDDYGKVSIVVSFTMSLEEARRAEKQFSELKEHPGWSFHSIMREALRPLLETFGKEYSFDNWGDKEKVM